MTFDNTKQLEQNNVVANIGRDNTSTLIGIYYELIMYSAFMNSLRSKRFRLVSEQRNTEEGDFRF